MEDVPQRWDPPILNCRGMFSGKESASCTEQYRELRVTYSAIFKQASKLRHQLYRRKYRYQKHYL